MMIRRLGYKLFVSLRCIFVVSVILVFIVLAPAVLLLDWFFGWISGENRWFRKRRAEFEARKPLPDGKFVSRLGLPPHQARIHIEVRRACADSCGLRADSLYPDDGMPLFFRMMWPFGDALDIVFRTEEALNIKISLKKVQERWCEAQTPDDELTLAGFAEAIAAVAENDHISLSSL